MVLLWELNFIRNTDGQQKLMFSRSYENGVYKEKELEDEKIIFVNYISLFPAKDIVRIKLGLQGNLLYSFYYIDKTYFDLGFLGIFGTSEYNENNPFDWPETELIAKFIFAEYFKRLKDGRLLDPEGSQQYLNWLDEQMQEYYQDFLDAKEKAMERKTKETRKSLMEAFQSAAATAEKKELEKKLEKRKKSTGLAKLKAISPGISEELEQMEQVEDIDWQNVDRKFEFMLINSFGNPLTKIMSFLNGNEQDWGTEEEQNAQSLEGMTYSVLKSFVEQQKLNLRNMQVRKAHGFEFILFYTVKIADQSYLIIMNVDNKDKDTIRSLPNLRGDEERIIERVAAELTSHPEWFDENGEFVNRDVSFEVESVFYRNCKRVFE